MISLLRLLRERTTDCIGIGRGVRGKKDVVRRMVEERYREEERISTNNDRKTIIDWRKQVPKRSNKTSTERKNK
jgi:hypothetical protein